jgi:hypothetical protein
MKHLSVQRISSPFPPSSARSVRVAVRRRETSPARTREQLKQPRNACRATEWKHADSLADEKNCQPPKPSRSWPRRGLRPPLCGPTRFEPGRGFAHSPGVWGCAKHIVRTQFEGRSNRCAKGVRRVTLCRLHARRPAVCTGVRAVRRSQRRCVRRRATSPLRKRRPSW